MTSSQSSPERILLHVCCADCLLRYFCASGYQLPQAVTALVAPMIPRKKLSQKQLIFNADKWQLFFYNPNIYPRAEYRARLLAVKKISILLSIPLIVADYQPQDYFNLSLVREQFKQGILTGNRCWECQCLRLAKTLQYCRQQSSSGTTMSTTMLASAYLSREQVIAAGKQICGQSFLVPKFTISPAQLKTSGFYKQNYCGCIFSLFDKTREKYFSSVNSLDSHDNLR